LDSKPEDKRFSTGRKQAFILALLSPIYA